MSFILHPWQLFFMILASWVHREQQKIIEFYQAELETVIKAQGRKRLLLTDDQRRLLARFLLPSVDPACDYGYVELPGLENETHSRPDGEA